MRGVPALLALFPRVGFNFSAPRRAAVSGDRLGFEVAGQRGSSQASRPVARAPGARVPLRAAAPPAARISGEVSSEIPPSWLAFLGTGRSSELFIRMGQSFPRS